MFNIFKEKCPTCKMILEKGKNYPEASGKKFCSESCKEKYEKNRKEAHSSGGSCCH